MMSLGGGGYGAYFDPDFDSLIERIQSPRVCIDNDTCDDCTLVEVDSANRHGILLEMVQVLTDLDLVILKSYISSDGGWLMDVFHVTDHMGKKLTDPSLILYIQQSLVTGKKESPREVRTCLGKLVGPGHLASEYTVVEFTAMDRPGLLSEVSAVLVKLDCHVVFAEGWTHNDRAACVMYLVDQRTRRPITSTERLADAEEQVEVVLSAHHGPGEKMHVRLCGPTPGRVHTERRLHQLMHDDRDYEVGPSPLPVGADQFTTAYMEPWRKGNNRGSSSSSSKTATQVSIDSWKEKDYSVVNVRSGDRPKLYFDTVCTLTDMQYVVFHAAVSAQEPIAVQEYYIRQVDGKMLDSESERRRVTRCLMSAVERRVSHGVRLDVCMKDKVGLLPEITRVVRENSMSLKRTEYEVRCDKVVATFFVSDASGGEVDQRIVEAMRGQMGAVGATMEIREPFKKNNVPLTHSGGSNGKADMEYRRKVSFGSLLWSHIERLSNFSSIRS